jgi:hypothetical protein
MPIGPSRQQKRPMSNLDVLFKPYRLNALNLPNLNHLDTPHLVVMDARRC